MKSRASKSSTQTPSRHHDVHSKVKKGHRAPRKKHFSDASTGTVTGTNSKHVMVTRGDAASSARNAVFNTNELLEAIIMEIPAKTILTLRAVNKHFHEMVMGSPKIQRKLFLKPEEEQTWVSKNGEKVLKEARDGELDEDGIEWTVPARLNDMLFELPSESLRDDLYQRMKICEPIALSSRPSLADRHSVYDKMYLSQPPTTEVEIRLYYAKRTGTKKFGCMGEGRVRTTIYRRSGVTWGHVLKAFKDQVGPGTKEDPSDGYLIKLGSSTLWMAGVVFPTEEETVAVKKASV